MSKLQSKGQYRAGVQFNPSGDMVVDFIKLAAADLIDEIEKIPVPVDSGGLGEALHQGETMRLKALAQTAIEEGAMWAVKAATKPKL